MNYTELFSLEDLNHHLREKLVWQKQHPEAALSLYDYSDRAQFLNQWDDVTMNCRGLIIDSANKVVARPLPKMFNLGWDIAPSFYEDEVVYATDKVDGSLGIAYPLDDTIQIATRGSFVSDVALHATKVLNLKYKDWIAQHLHDAELYTYVFEIVAPQHRIAIDYGRQDDLYLIGATHIESGRFISAAEHGRSIFSHWNGPEVEVLFHGPYKDLEIPDRENREGYVIHSVSRNTLVKVKQQDYITRQKALWNLSARNIYDGLVSHRNPLSLDAFAEVMEGIPDESAEWARGIFNEIRYGFHSITQHQVDRFYEIIDSVPNGENASRKKLAEAARKSDIDLDFFFLYLDRNYAKIESKVLKMIRPEGNRFFRKEYNSDA